MIKHPDIRTAIFLIIALCICTAWVGEGIAQEKQRLVRILISTPYTSNRMYDPVGDVMVGSIIRELNKQGGIEIIPRERGSGGFGYDQVFLCEDTGRTMAELGIRKKNRISHRAKAARAILPHLRSALT